MRFPRSILFGAAVALIGAGCEVHEHDGGTAAVGVTATYDEPQGAVVEGPGVEAIDVEPDPAQRVYIYDEGYPPGTYMYDNYYYYGGYRYPRDIFVNRYVHENIAHHRFANKEENRRQAQAIEQRHRTEFTQTHGRVQHGNTGPAQRNEPARHEQAPIHQPQTPAVNPNVERHEPRAEPRPENRTPAKEEEHRAAPEQHAAPQPGRLETNPREGITPRNEPRPSVQPHETRPPQNEEHKATENREKHEEK